MSSSSRERSTARRAGGVVVTTVTFEKTPEAHDQLDELLVTLRTSPRAS